MNQIDGKAVPADKYSQLSCPYRHLPAIIFKQKKYSGANKHHGRRLMGSLGNPP